MLATFLIVFREIIEAGLIVGIVLAATRGTLHRGRWIGLGVVAGAALACLVAACAGRIATLFDGSGQGLFNAAILLLAVAMLTWHNVWMSTHGRTMAQELRRLGAAVVAGTRAPKALAVVCGVAVLREGSELALFLYGVAAAGGSSAAGMLAGGGLGLLAGAGVSALMYFGLLSIPAHRLFAATTGLITLLAAGLAAQAVDFLQQAGYFEVWTSTLWNTSWLLPDDSIGGRLVHTLIGYTAQPSGAQLAVYLATVAGIVSLTRVVRGPRRAAIAAQRA
jgi:high-affinity iron transporter